MAIYESGNKRLVNYGFIDPIVYKHAQNNFLKRYDYPSMNGYSKVNKMAELEEAAGRQPDYKGDGVAVWINETKKGEKYLSINLLNSSIKTAAFKYVPKEKPKNNEL